MCLVRLVQEHAGGDAREEEGGVTEVSNASLRAHGRRAVVAESAGTGDLSVGVGDNTAEHDLF